MMWRDVVELVAVVPDVNDISDPIDTETKTTVFANKKSIRQTEFYQAQAAGLKPELMFVIRYADYTDQRQLEYNSKRYDIVRTYTKNDETIELICAGIVNGVL